MKYRRRSKLLSMIELCTKKRMVFAVIALICLSIVTLILESRWSYQRKLNDARFQAMANANETCKSGKYTALDVCKSCTRDELRREVHYCLEKGYKMLIQCENTKIMYTGCGITPDAEQRQFWIFEGVCLVIGIVSYLIVHQRRSMLDQIMMDKINKQIAAGI
ncbi:uncharacterized protein [Haliotis cracherodii]|uniref:uncharacterized protein n=1 Tax=Haliotis cracherodii TaxID=6455 RepID=UPI0039E84737